MSTKEMIKSTGLLPNAFEDYFKPWSDWLERGNPWKGFTVPAVNITENENDYKVALAVPGMQKKDFKIDVEANMLTISAESEGKKEEKDERYTRKEYNYSSFSRSFNIPDGVNKDKIDANYKDGVLTLVLPKREEAKKSSVTKHISVN